MKKIRIETKSGELVKEFENVIIYDDNFTPINSDGRIECCLMFDDISSLNLNWKEIEVEEKGPVTRWLWLHDIDEDNKYFESGKFYTEKEAAEANKKRLGKFYKKLEWSATEFPE